MGEFFGGVAGIGFMLASLAGWLTHLYVCFNEELWGFLIAGAIFFPVGVFHGWGLWFGWW
ncbi:hypothetical protein [Mesorhizobium sp.]|uniref:hypothetical protein n=1 Tax=Mesorhizobium sp. TaxID=1871066 RepID=UPI000FE85C8E|nr:hypothetical protein [Mesorhizobium sp.]RWK76256.1 MAG: hypothetical protein EOR50_14775 [Mesorhizobium sp.]RWK81029.1 MAG: hypothetical protein EOR51_16405 [Mesorhizobium sp.]RWL08350.1 MAG: hypothetical protein EOR55_04120 [Mesorhizobium sp.]RWL12149.1 MAG: hypothetical protein EOR56_15070 [Mesorhizobium sp.]